MKTHRLFGLAALLTLSLPLASRADLDNSGFESGDFTSWSLSVPAKSDVVMLSTISGTSPEVPVSPTEGTHFAVLTSGDPGVYTRLSQGFTAEVGDTLSFDILFDGFDFLPFNDDAYARIIDGATNTSTVLYAKDIAAVGDFGHDGWTTVTHDFTAAGRYLLEFGVRNSPDNGFPSRLFVDRITGSIRAVPTPGSLTLMCLGGLGVIGFVPFRRHKA